MSTEQLVTMRAADLAQLRALLAAAEQRAETAEREKAVVVGNAIGLIAHDACERHTEIIHNQSFAEFHVTFKALGCVYCAKDANTALRALVGELMEVLVEWQEWKASTVDCDYCALDDDHRICSKHRAQYDSIELCITAVLAKAREVSGG